MTLEGLKLRINSLVGISLSPTYEKMLRNLIKVEGETEEETKSKNVFDFLIRSTPELIRNATRQHDFFILHESGLFDRISYTWEENFLGLYRFYDGEHYKYIVAFPCSSI